MKALILAGGFTTRLMTLTLTVPEALVDFANKPMILHQRLESIGVKEVVVGINCQPKVLKSFFKECEGKLGIKMRCSQEAHPMDTATRLALARDKLIDGSGEPFFVLNGDVICEYPLKEMIEFHKSHGGEALIMVTEVNGPSKHAVVAMETTRKVEKFVERPINAGIYALDPSVMDRIEIGITSIEKDISPQIAAEQKLFSMLLPGFWTHIGQPLDYIKGLRLYLDSKKKYSPSRFATGPNFLGSFQVLGNAQVLGSVIVDDTAEIGKHYILGPNVTMGPGCFIESGVHLNNCIMMPGARIKKDATVTDSILGWHSIVEGKGKVDGKGSGGDPSRPHLPQNPASSPQSFLTPHPPFSFFANQMPRG